MSETDSPLRSTVAAAIAALFAPDDQDTITEMMIEECNVERLYSSSEDGLERIQLAVLKISEGEVDKFLAAVELAQIDWRDALISAGFGHDVKAHLKWAETFRE